MPTGAPAAGHASEVAWREFRGRLHAFVAGRLRDPADAEDIVQQVFLRLHRNQARLRHAESVGAWLYRAARNAIADHYRAPARRRESPVGDTREWDRREAAADPAPLEEATGAACAAECLRPLMRGLPEEYRRALEAVDVQGMTQADAAAAAGVSLSGMKSRVQRGRARLRASLLERCRVALDARGSVVGCETPTPGAPGCGSAGRPRRGGG